MSSLELEAEQMRRLGYEAVDALVQRWQELAEDVPWRGGSRAELEELLGGPPPDVGVAPSEVMRRALVEILPRAGRIDHPRFFAFIPSSPTWPSVLARFLTAGFNVFQGTWLESAGPSQVELVVLDWFRGWLGYPDGSGGLFTSGGSVANLLAFVAAREEAGSPVGSTVYTSDQGHSSLLRAARVTGISDTRVRKIQSDQDFRIDPAALAEAIERDRAAGLVPILVAASAGSTNTGSVDPLEEVGRVCRQAGVWFHVDAAYGGFAMLSESARHLLRGIASADSVTLDPHKWLFQPYESGCLMVRDERTLESTFATRPEYLQDTGLGEGHVNFGERGVQLSRSFRALGVWMSVQTFGVSAHRDAIDRAIELARSAERRVRASSQLQLLSPASLGIVCFRFLSERGGSEDLDELNAAVQERLVAEGTAMTSSTRLRGVYALRLCVLNYRTSWKDVDATLSRIEELGEQLGGPGGERDGGS